MTIDNSELIAIIVSTGDEKPVVVKDHEPVRELKKLKHISLLRDV